MLQKVFGLLKPLKNTPLHPQWLSHRFHAISRRRLSEIHDAVVLDIGAGDSAHKELNRQDNVLYRLDYPPTNYLYSRRPDIYGDACALPIAGEAVDAVLLLEVLEHVECGEQVLAEIHRVLKPGGQLLISVPFIYPIHDAPYDYWRFTRYGLRALLRRKRFQIVAEIEHGNSLITVLQMFNLALLEAARDMGRKVAWLGLILGIAVFPLCLLSNLLAVPLLFLPWRSAACFGYFLVAKRTHTN